MLDFEAYFREHKNPVVGIRNPLYLWVFICVILWHCTTRPHCTQLSPTLTTQLWQSDTIYQLLVWRDNTGPLVQDASLHGWGAERVSISGCCYLEYPHLVNVINGILFSFSSTLVKVVLSMARPSKFSSLHQVIVTAASMHCCCGCHYGHYHCLLGLTFLLHLTSEGRPPFVEHKWEDCSEKVKIIFWIYRELLTFVECYDATILVCISLDYLQQIWNVGATQLVSFLFLSFLWKFFSFFFFFLSFVFLVLSFCLFLFLFLFLSISFLFLLTFPFLFLSKTFFFSSLFLSCSFSFLFSFLFFYCSLSFLSFIFWHFPSPSSFLFQNLFFFFPGFLSCKTRSGWPISWHLAIWVSRLWGNTFSDAS